MKLRTEIARGWGRRDGGRLETGTKYRQVEVISSSVLQHSEVTIVYNNIIHTL